MPRETLIQVRRGTAAAWTAANPTLAAGEAGLETDTGNLKYGDGSTAWASLDYFAADAVLDPDTTLLGNPITAEELDYLSGVTSNVQTQLDGKAASVHTHSIANVTGLQAAIDGKAATSHTHAISDVTSLQAALDTIDDHQPILLDAFPDANLTANGPQTATLAAGATIAAGECVRLGSGGKWLLVDADAEATAAGLLAIALEAKNDTEAMRVALPGCFVRFDTWNWTAGATLYVSTTPGGLTETQPSGADDVIRVAGWALTADVVYFNPSADYVTHV